MSRIIQGTVTGIGFIGGGVILKQSEQHHIEGITTAAGIWLTATVGIVTGMGRLGLAIAGAILAFHPHGCRSAQTQDNLKSPGRETWAN